MLESHDSLKVFSEWMAAIGGGGSIALAGWVNSLRQQKARIEERIEELKITVAEHSRKDEQGFNAQWARIDDIKNTLGKAVMQEQQDNFRKEMTDMIEKTMRPMSDGLLRLEAKLDKFIMGGSK